MSESSLDFFKVSYNFEIWIINTDSKSWRALSSVYCMTFYKLQNSLKSPPPPECRKAFQGLYFKIFPGEHAPVPPTGFSCLRCSTPQAKTKLYAYMSQISTRIQREQPRWTGGLTNQHAIETSQVIISFLSSLFIIYDTISSKLLLICWTLTRRIERN